MDGARYGYKRERSPMQDGDRTSGHGKRAPTSTIKIRGERLDEENLKRLFSDCGEIRNIRVNRYESFVTFES
jgi:hypothetical protein